MYISTRGIVFRQIKYSDTSLVVRIFTEELGLRSYMLKGARSSKSKLKPGLFQPLSLLDLIVSEKEKGELHHIREARLSYSFKSIPFDIKKSSILLFINELIYKSIQEESANRELFGFIYDRIVQLDELQQNISHFHLLFSVRLTRFLGFFPQGEYHGLSSSFSLEEGTFTENVLLPGEYTLQGPHANYLNQLIVHDFDDLASLSAPHEVRMGMLERLILYYRLHLPMATDFKSHLVLKEVLQ